MKASVCEAKKLRKRAQITASQVQKELAKTIEIKMQRKEEADRKKIEKRVKNILANKGIDHAVSLCEVFPDLDSASLDVVLDIVNGSVVKRLIVHNWAVGDRETDIYEAMTYNCKIEKLKAADYSVCYWGLEQDNDTDGEDFKIKVFQMVVDFVFGELKFLS